MTSLFISLPQDVQNRINSYASQFGVDPLVCQAIAQVQSGGQQFDAENNVTENGQFVGVMGVLPSSVAQLGLDLNTTSGNIQAGVEYMASLLQVFVGSYPFALAAYVTSVDSVQTQHGIPPVPLAQNFVYSVSGLAAQAGSPAVSRLLMLKNQALDQTGTASTEVGNLIDPRTHGRDYGSGSKPEEANQAVAALQASMNPDLQIDAGLDVEPWYDDQNLTTGNRRVRNAVVPVSFMVYLARTSSGGYVPDANNGLMFNPQTFEPIQVQLNTSITTFELTSKHVYNRTPSRTGMHVTLWGMQPDLISGSGTTGVFMNQAGITDYFSTASINDTLAQMVGRAFPNSPDVEMEIAANPEAFRVAAQDAFVEFMKLFQMNGNVWFYNQNYTGVFTGQDQAAPNAWSPGTGASSFQQNARNNDVMTRGYVAMKYRNNVYLGYFKSLSWTEDAENPFQWKFNFTFQVERTYTSLFTPNPAATLAQALSEAANAGPVPTSTSSLPDQIG
jgi:hypothetical protein